MFAGLLGLLLLGTGAYVLVAADIAAAWRYLSGLTLLLAGADAIHGVVTGRRPWIARIGPLP